MPGENVHLTPLESRKQLLLVESELNRTQLLNELRNFKDEISHLNERAHAIGSIASSAAKLATILSAIGNAFTHNNSGDRQSSWLSKLLNRARAWASIWGALRSSLN